MSWRDQVLASASFRGISFFVESVEQSGGRRGPIHEYPRRDLPFFDDLGRKSRGFPINGFVVGNDYFAARDALITALEGVGPGELVHPYRGTKRVVCTEFLVRETRDKGGKAEFSMTFVEVEAAPTQPTAIPATGAVALTSVANARSATTAEFLSQYSPGALLASVVGAVQSASAAVNDVLAQVALTGQDLSVMRRRVRTFASTAVALTNAPDDLVAALTDILNGFAVDAVDALLALYSFNPGTRPPATTSNRLQEQKNFDAFQLLTQRLVVMRCAELTLDRTFASYDEAAAARSALTALLDDQSEIAADDTYPALAALRAALVKAVPGAESQLPRLLRHTPTTTVPSLVLAHDLYGDVSLEQDLVDRNRVRNPLFVAGGVSLEVLSHE